MLGFASAVVALPAAAIALSTKFGFTEREIPRLHEITFTAGTAALVVSCAVVIGAGVGLIALTRTSMVGLYDRLRSSRSTSSIGWRRAQNGLVAFQVAIALTMGIPLLGGPTVRSGDLRGAPAIEVSERLAASLFGTTDVVGRRIMVRVYEGLPLRAFTVVGVVGDVPWGRIEDGLVPMVYYPILRDGDGLPDPNPIERRPTEVQYVIRGTQPPSATIIQETLTQLDHRVPAANVRTLGSLVDDATARVRLTMLLIAVAGVAALLLGVIGVYTVVSYAANGRMREFSIRLALGAAPSRVGGMVLGAGLRLVAIGVVAGLAAAFGATRFPRSLLYGVRPTSVAEFGMATALLVVAAVLAALVPARRAARTHPAMVLRGE